MEEKDITANMAHEAIARQSNEDEVAAVFRLHIMRFWSRDRIENFCLHLLGIDMQEYRAWRQAVEQSRAPDVGESSWQKKWPAKFYPLIPFPAPRKPRRR